ncbi:MAG: alpha/beta hydrolase domain-containing protein, partial [Candidatus Microthrix subdominans]
MKRTGIVMGLLTVALLSAACGGGDSAGETSASTTSPGDETGTTGSAERPDGPAATFGEELTGGNGMSLVSAAEVPDLAEAGYTETEYAVAGTATAYESDGDLPADGAFELTETGEGDFNTRVVVRRPEKAADFNGTVVVEWLNVSSGADVAPDYTYMADEIIRGGYAWVGVSAQHIGIEGGPVAVAAPGSEFTGAGKGLAAFDPER